MLRFLTAGESHGKALVVIVEGLPSNLTVDEDVINFHLKRRQSGYGRGLRMKIESDTVEILSGIRNGRTLGSPVAMMIRNKDWENWKDIMAVRKAVTSERISIPRPGHADLTGTSKYNYNDIRNSIERSSARETAARTAAGTLARILLGQFGISVGSYVESIGAIYANSSYYQKLLNNITVKQFTGWSLSETADRSEVRVLDDEQEKRIINKIKWAKKKGDTLGGTFVVAATGIPPGLGSFMHYDRKLDAALSSAIMSIQAVKAVEIGAGFISADIPGSLNNDEIIFSNETLSRRSNYAGGIEGGISSGMPLLIKGAMKPVATLMNPVMSVDLKTMKPSESRRERSDFTAVPACAVIAEAAVCWTVAEFLVEKFGGDSLEELTDNYKNYTKKLMNRLRRNFR